MRLAGTYFGLMRPPNVFGLSFSPAESFGLSAKLGPGTLWGSHPARFREVSRFQVKVPEGSVRVPSEGPRRFQTSRFEEVARFQIRVPSQVSRRDFKYR